MVEVETAVQVNEEELLALCQKSRSSATTAKAADDVGASPAPKDSTSNFMTKEINMNSMRMWLTAIIAPAFAVAAVGMFLIKRQGRWMLVAINMILSGWTLFTGMDPTPLFVMTGMPYDMDWGKDDNSWAPIKAFDIATFIYFIHHVMIFTGKLRKVPNSVLSSQNDYPLPTLPISYTITFAIFMLAILLLLWVQAFVVIRWTMLTLAVLGAIAALVLFVSVSLYFGGIGGDWYLYSRDSSHTVNKTLYVLWMLTSLASMLASTFVSFDALRCACLVTSALAGVAAFLCTLALKHDKVVGGDQPIATGYFARPSLWSSTCVAMAFFGLVATMSMPIIGTLAYTHVYGIPSMDGTPSSFMNWIWCLLAVAIIYVVMLTVVALSQRIRRIPLTWSIMLESNRWVDLSVDTLGTGSHKFFRVAQAYRGPIRQHGGDCGKESYVTDHGRCCAVIVECYDPTYFIRRGMRRRGQSSLLFGKSNVHLHLTPEDPELFLDLISQAMDQAKQK